MSRGPLKVDSEWDSTLRVGAEVMFDRDTKIFFARFMHQRYEAPSVDELKMKLRAAFKRLAPVKWERFIGLHTKEESDTFRDMSDGPRIQSHEVGFLVAFSRYESGRTTEGKRIRRPFTEDLPESWQEDVAENPLHFANSSESYDTDQEIPFSEATWSALLAIEDAMEKAHAKLVELFDPKDGGRKLLALTGLALLPASTAVVGNAPRGVELAPGESAAEYVERKHAETTVDGHLLPGEKVTLRKTRKGGRR
jgi:hypothetical protein